MKLKWNRLNQKTYSVLLILLSLLFVTVFVTGIFAKYGVNMQGEGTIGAKKFYFESDTLSTENPEYTLVSTTTSITFNLKNFKDELNVSEMNINYEISVDAKVTSTSAAANAPTIKKGNEATTDGTLTASTKVDEEITLSDLKVGNTYVVTVRGDGGYKKTLKATFIILEKDLGLYMNVKDGDRVALTVMVSEAEGNVIIQFPKGLTLDKGEDPHLDGVMVTGDGENKWFEYPLNQKQSKLFYFVKANPSTKYSANDFTVTMNGKIATVVDIID